MIPIPKMPNTELAHELRPINTSPILEEVIESVGRVYKLLLFILIETV
jgi:hypothetical protein